jgi:hypothetical protein
MVRLVILRILESYFRRWLLYPLPIPLLLVLAIVSSMGAKQVFISRGALYVQNDTLLGSLTSIGNSGGFAWVTPADATSDEFKELRLTDAFIRAVIKQTDLEAKMSSGEETVNKIIQEVREAIWIEVLGKNLLLIGAVDEDAKIAQQLAAASIEAYIQWKITADRNESASAQTFFSDLVTGYRAELAQARQDLDSYLEEHPDPVRGDRPLIEDIQIKRLEEAVGAAAMRLSNTIDKEDSAKLALAQSEGKARQTYLVIDTPAQPLKPETAKKDLIMKVVMFAVVGVILGVIGVIGAALLDGSFRFPIDVRHGVDLPVLALVPDVSSPGKKPKRK